MAISKTIQLVHPLTKELLFRAMGDDDSVLLDLRYPGPFSSRVMQPVFFVYSEDHSSRWIHAALVIVFEETDFPDASAVRFVIEHHPKFTKMDKLLFIGRSLGEIQDEVSRVVDWFVQTEIASLA